MTFGEGSLPRYTLILAGLLLFGAAFGIRFARIDASSLWQDEVVQLRRTTLTLPEVWKYTPGDKLPLDYLVQSMLVGRQPDERRARLHACLFGAGFVVAFAGWALRVQGLRLAIIGALLALSLPFQVRFSLEGGPYALAIFALTLLFGATLPVPHTRTRRWWAGLTFLLLLCAWSYYLLVIPVALALTAGLVWTAWDGRDPGASGADREKTPAGWGFVIGCLIALLLGVMPILIRTFPRFVKLIEDRGPKQGAFDVSQLPHYLDTFAMGYATDQFVPYAGWVLVGLMLAGLVGSPRGAARSVAAACVFTGGLTFVLTLLLFLMADRWFKVRYFVFCVPPVLMLASLGVDAVGGAVGGIVSRSRGGRGIAAVTLAAAIGLIHTGYVLARPVQRDDWRSVVERVEEEAGPKSVLLVSDWHSLGVLGYYLELLEVDVAFRGIYFDPEPLAEKAMEGKDVWVLATHEDWWNIDRGEISEFLSAYALLPQSIPDVWGIEIRRNRTPGQLAEDRALTPLDRAGADLLPLRLSLEGEASPYLGGGWFVSYPWAAEVYRQSLMATRGSLLLPLEEPKPLEVRARLRRGGESASATGIEISLNGDVIGGWDVGNRWAAYESALPDERLKAGLNVLEFQASESLRIGAPAAGDEITSPSVEVDWIEVGRRQEEDGAKSGEPLQNQSG